MASLSAEEFMRQIEDRPGYRGQGQGLRKRHRARRFWRIKVPCPKCGGVIKENYKKFQCQKCDFALWKIVAGRQLEIPEIEELITKRKIGPLQGFRAKQGRPFAAIIKLTTNSSRNLTSASRAKRRGRRRDGGLHRRRSLSANAPTAARPFTKTA